ncbi:LOW QUALITY PROTEIN: uncharacterized protein LOC108095835 [Drosophila ficusphila]|uniref:LOW QUALITY PROTEIN: uncharacterized protein LOC108095835 n=1 Tax=Drosophila ficusphila TaxID=30025 RepID=UPI001C89ABDD|nr:LOW QUALITY PROTEIN: uncharacterized protein LOC108095835 [Drosophila ficusphila]
MFPNYCFTKSARQSDYDVIRKGYIARESCQHTCNHNRSESVRRSKKKRSLSKSSSSRVKDSSSKSVGFRLTPVVCSSQKDTRETAGENCQKDKKCFNLKMDSNRDLQDTFADFFSIIHDNVLESVQEVVKRMVTKCFDESLAKMERLSKNLEHQEALLNKIHRDITSKMADQSETSLNQFKFVTQMLIDNQTVHYRALNQAKLNKERRKEERELEKERKLERERKRKCACKEVENERSRWCRSSSADLSKRSTGGDGKELTPRCQQHLLCQQQEPLVYQMCKSCSNKEAISKGKRMSRSPSRHTNTPVLQKRSTSYSMPDLSARTSSTSRRFNQPQPSNRTSRTSLSRSCDRRPKQIVCLPAMTYPPYVRNCPVPRRRIGNHIKYGIGSVAAKQR